MSFLNLIKKSAFVAAIATIAFSSTSYAEELKISGSTTVYANVFEPYQANLEKQTGLKLKVIGNGSSRGLEDLIAGKSNMGMISSSMESMKRKVTTEGINELQAHRIGTGRVVFITHKSNPVKKLTFDQLKSILLGKTKNWSEIGGEDKPIVVVSEYKGGGIRSTVEKKVLDKASFAGNVKELANGTQIVKVAAQIPGSLGVASAVTLNDKVSVLETDKKLEQPLSLVTKGEPNADAAKLISVVKELLAE